MITEHHRSSSEDGLVISDITGGSPDPVEAFADGFVEAATLHQAAAGFASLPPRQQSDTRPRYSIELSPGSVRLTRASPPRHSPPANYKPRTKIVEWSRKSRASMTFRLSTLDYRPLFRDGRIPAMITLTYPGKWQAVAPTAAATQAHLKAFRKRYEERYGEPFVALWKREHQRSGSPHFHLFLAPPRDQQFATWLSAAWADIVNHPDPEQRRRHERAGTGLDYAKGLRSTDPRRVAVYFSKHNSANFGKKEYQNKPPAEWIEAENIGRFWGYWKLKPLVIGTEISDQDAIYVARLLRRWSRANSTPRRKQVQRIDTKTGQVKTRYVTRRIERFGNGRGFALANDGSALGASLALAVQLRNRADDGRLGHD